MLRRKRILWAALLAVLALTGCASSSSSVNTSADSGTESSAADAADADAGEASEEDEDSNIRDYGTYTVETIMLEGGDGYLLETHIMKPAGVDSFPVVMTRSCYPGMEASYLETGEKYIAEGIGYVFQYSRGKGESEGTFEPNTYEKEDGTALMNWLAEQDWCESIGIQGCSYSAYCAWVLGDDLNEKVKGMYLEQYGVDRYVSLYKDGLFREDLMTGWAIDNATEDITKPSWGKGTYFEYYLYMPQLTMDVDMLGAELSWYREWIMNTEYTDEYWNEGVWGQLKDVPSQITVPVTIVAGWYDHHLEGTLLGYEWLSDEVKEQSRLIIGPWLHGYSISPTHVTTDHAGDIDIEQDAIEWFKSILLDDEVPEGGVDIYYIEEDTWIETDAWPLGTEDTMTLYLTTQTSEENALAYALSDTPAAEESTITYVYDPEDPVESVGGETLYTSMYLRGSIEQEEIGYRDDVISFLSDELTEDLVLSGEITATIYVSTDVDDTCFVYKVSEVLPDGTAYNIRTGITTLAFNGTEGVRGTYEAGEIVEITIDTLPIAWSVSAGSRIRIDITSSDFPEYSVHSNYAGIWSTQEETRIANQVIYTGEEYPSSVTFRLGSME